MKELKAGISASMELTPGKKDLASSMGSGSLDVFATPAMIALMENTASLCVEPYLEGDETTVGTEVNVRHISATPDGMKVTAEAVLTEVNGRELVFTVKASDEAGLIGEGTHKRFVVYGKRFMEKTNAKK